MENYDLIIIGGGVAGGAGLMYAGRMGMKAMLIGDSLGGTLILTDNVENYPGFKRLTGQQLSDNIFNHAKEYDGKILETKVTEVKKHPDGCFEVKTKDETFRAKSVIFATGTKWRKLDVPGSKEFENRGVHYCALCDGYFYKDKVVALIGGADSAAKEALLMTEHAKKVYLIARGERIKAEPINLKRLEMNKKIEIILNTNLTEIAGDKTVTHIKLDKPHKGSDKLELDGLFIAIGHIPMTEEAAAAGVELDSHKFIKVDRDTNTNVPGIFAAGDCVDSKFKQAIVGVGEAVVAVYSAYQFVTESEVKCK